MRRRVPSTVRARGTLAKLAAKSGVRGGGSGGRPFLGTQARGYVSNSADRAQPRRSDEHCSDAQRGVGGRLHRRRERRGRPAVRLVLQRRPPARRRRDGRAGAGRDEGLEGVLTTTSVRHGTASGRWWSGGTCST